MKLFDSESLPATVEGWTELQKALLAMGETERLHCQSILIRVSLYYMLRFVLSTKVWKDDDEVSVWERPFTLEFANSIQSDWHNVLDIAARGHLKHLAVDTPIPTPSGWEEIGNLRVGDEVFDRNGEVTKVVAVSDPVKCRKLVKLSGKRGPEFITSEEHRWWVKCGRSEDFLTTEEIGERLPRQRGHIGIPYHRGLDLPPKDLPVDPYILGVWLGDGTVGSSHITAHCDDAPAMAENLRNRGYEIRFSTPPSAKSRGVEKITVGSKHYGGDGSGTGPKNDFLMALDGLGVRYEKRIPKEYLRASKGQRLDLLAGLMDTDGTSNPKTHQCSFNSAIEGLADDFVELASSLGYRASKYFVDNNHSGSYHVCFCPVIGDGVFKLKRKNDRLPESRPFVKSWQVESVSDYHGEREGVCISVDSPTQTFLAGRNMVPTGNSTIKTFALPLQLLLNNPDTTIGIFSFNRELSKKFALLIKQEVENNTLLQELSWDMAMGKRIFPVEPKKEVYPWSMRDGLTVNRSTNSKEASIEWYGLVDSMPTGRHFKVRLYDDVVTQDSVTTPEQLQKTSRALSLSQALGMPGGKATYTGTFYAYGDPHFDLIKSGVRLRLNPCYRVKDLELNTVKGQIVNVELDENDPVFMTKDELAEYTKSMLPNETGTQMRCDPNASLTKGFDPDHLMYYDNDPFIEAKNKNLYILVDAANDKKKGSSYTAMLVMAAGADKNLYLIDGVRDRMNLEERTRALFLLHRKWNPLQVRYERYGMMVDIPHIKYVQGRDGYRFRIHEVAGSLSKDDRIERLQPLFAAGRIWMPRKLPKIRVDGTTYDLIDDFVNEEYNVWPSSGTYKDMLDAMARIAEPELPVTYPKSELKRGAYMPRKKKRPKHSWMTA